MKNDNSKVVSIRLIYVILIVLALVGITFFSIKYIKNNKINNQNKNIATIRRKEENVVSSRSEENSRRSSEEENTNIEVNEIEGDEEKEEVQFYDIEELFIEHEPEVKYISISEVKISQDMDLTIRTGLSKEDFITLISGVKADTSGFFEENAGLIYDLCEEYSLNEVFFCGIISAESGWNIAQNHRNTHNYISLMVSGKLKSFGSTEEGLREAARVLHTNYLTPGGKFYFGKTLSAMKTRFCPESSTWVSLVYGRMRQII